MLLALGKNHIPAQSAAATQDDPVGLDIKSRLQAIESRQLALKIAERRDSAFPRILAIRHQLKRLIIAHRRNRRAFN
jgi:hypothetical protein